jgi:acyl dehydratase
MSTDATVATSDLPVEPIALQTGDEMPVFTLGPVTRTDIVRYAGAGGDFNVIHHDDEFARAAGLESVFSMGLLHGGVLAQRLARWVGPHNVERFRLRFTGQVWPGDVVRFAGCVTATDEREGRHYATCELSATTQRDDEVLRAEALVRVVADDR